MRTARIQPTMLALLLVCASACGPDAAPPTVLVRGDPISGDPIAGDPITSDPIAGTPIDDVPPPAPPFPSEPLPPLGDMTPPSEAVPADETPLVAAKPVPAAPPASSGEKTAAASPEVQADAAKAEAPKAGDPNGVAPPAPEAAPKDAAAKPDPAAKPDAAAPAKPSAPRVLSFETLASFEYLPPDPEVAGSEIKSLASIPDEIKKLDGEHVSVEGYMLPLEYADDGVKSFLVSRHQMGCCFGVLPKPNELVEVEMPAGKIAPYVSYIPVMVTGKLRVGPKEGASTVLSGIYRMDEPVVTIPEPEE